ncbi:MAG TPA: NAD(P)/FAD-dependent oxidoreductase [Candidatus Binatia bacterium]|nr:NAD(P)/FAD-dependent oxidoreductase [Candidatus Binatia bacterium]
MRTYDAIIIGAGHNGLVTAAYLARAGKKVLVVERRSISGGIVATEEIFPAFKYNACVHLCGSFSRAIAEDLQLGSQGLEMIDLEPLLFAPSPDGGSLLIPRHPASIAEEIGRFSKTDAEKFESFCALIRKLTAFLHALNGISLPDRASHANFKLSELIKLGWKLRRLGKNDMHEFLRIMPMSIADLVSEWFETELLKAALAASGVRATSVGPRAQGTSLVFLHHQLGDSNGAFQRSGFVLGGVGNLAQAIARAARQYGAEIQTGSEVVRIVTKNGSAAGVVLSTGEEITATSVVSNADVKRTFLSLVEPTYLDPHFLLQVRNIKSRASVAKVNLALDAPPHFKSPARHGSSNPHRGVIHIGPTLDALERAADDAKYGRFSRAPWLEITIPSAVDPSLAPAGKHVMSVWMQYAPYKLRGSGWDQEREALGDLVVSTIENYAPGFTNSILHRQVLTPLDLERIYGLTGGHIYHAELTLDQAFFMRPVPGWARYRTPIKKLYLCGSDTHPAGGVTGLPGYYAAREILQEWRRNK